MLTTTAPSEALIDAANYIAHSNQRDTYGNFFGYFRRRWIASRCIVRNVFNDCVCTTNQLISKIENNDDNNIQICPQSIFIRSTPIDISDKSFTLSCLNDRECILDGENALQLFVGSPTTVTFIGLTFFDWKADAGAVMSFTGTGTVHLQDCIFDSNQATTGSGGAIRLQDASLTVTNCTFQNSLASVHGGAIYAVSSSSSSSSSETFEIFINDTRFLNNEAREKGGGLYSNGASLTTLNTQFTECESGFRYTGTTPGNLYGGALYLENSVATLQNILFRKCSTAGNGGAIASNFSKISLQPPNILFVENIAGGDFPTAKRTGADLYILDDADPATIGTFIDCQTEFCSTGGSGTDSINEIDFAFRNTNCNTTTNQTSSTCDFP